MKATKIISGLRRHSSYFISVLLIHNTLQEKVAAEQKVDNSAQLIHIGHSMTERAGSRADPIEMLYLTFFLV